MMKKTISIAVILFAVILYAFQQPKTLKVQADAATWQAILNVIDLSDAPPKDRVAARNFIINQLNDSTINKK